MLQDNTQKMLGDLFQMREGLRFERESPSDTFF